MKTKNILSRIARFCLEGPTVTPLKRSKIEDRTTFRKYVINNVFILLITSLLVRILFNPGTALQAGRSLVRFPMVSLEFFIDIILPAALWPRGSTQPLTEMSTRSISWG